MRSAFHAAVVLLAAAHAGSAQTAADAMRGDALSLSREGRWEQARGLLLRARAAFPEDKRFAIDLAGVSFRMGDRRAALVHIRSALRLDPDDAYADNFAGTLYLLEGNLAAAVKYWNRIGKPALRAVRVPNDPGVDPGLLRNALPRPGGGFLTSQQLRATRADLERLDVFSSYRLELDPVAEEGFELRFDGAARGELHAGFIGRVLPFVRSLPFQAVHADFPNIGASAIHFRSMWRWDPDKRRALISMAGPVASNPRWRLGMTLDVRDENWDTGAAFSMRRNDLAVEMGRRVTDRLAMGVSTHLTRRRFTGADNGRLFTNGASLKQVARLSYLAADYPEHRLTAGVNASGEAGRVFGGATFAKARGDVTARWLPGRWSLEGRLLAGKMAGAAPFDELFVLGMERDHDLWLRGHVATRDGRKGASPLARDYVVLQTGAVRDVWRLPAVQIGIGPFLDTGRGWGAAGGLGSRNWMVDAGLELRVRVLSGVTARLIYGRNLRDGRGAFYSAVSR